MCRAKIIRLKVRGRRAPASPTGGAEAPNQGADRTRDRCPKYPRFEDPLVTDVDDVSAEESLEIRYAAEWIVDTVFRAGGDSAKVEPRG
jgi:hypothetical protein